MTSFAVWQGEGKTGGVDYWFQTLEGSYLVSGSRPRGPTLGSVIRNIHSCLPVDPSVAERGLGVGGLASLWGYWRTLGSDPFKSPFCAKDALKPVKLIAPETKLILQDTAAVQLSVFIKEIERQCHSAFSASKIEVLLLFVDVTVVNKPQHGVTVFKCHLWRCSFPSLLFCK